MSRPERGHQTLPHTADVILEAWGPDVSACAEEAAAALLDIVLSHEGATTSVGPVMQVESGSTASMVETVLDDLIYLLDTSDLVPVGVSVEPSNLGGLEMRTRVAPRSTVRSAGPAPKAVVLVSVVSPPSGPRCRFIVDV